MSVETYILDSFSCTPKEDNSTSLKKFDICALTLVVFEKNAQIIIITFNTGDRQKITLPLEGIKITQESDCMATVESEMITYYFQFKTYTYIKDFIDQLKGSKNSNGISQTGSELTPIVSAFEERTDRDSATTYFNFYAQLCQQQNMLQDSVRTYTFYQAIIQNSSDYKDKVVLDVGAGSGILSFFAAQAGAKKVYAVEASDVAFLTKKLVQYNNYYSEIIEVIKGKIEEITLPEYVDTIISEPIGYMLLNERMLESFVYAKKFLKPNGKIFPTRSILYFAPFTDEYLYEHIICRSSFWSNPSFYGIDLNVLYRDAFKEACSQPIIDYVDLTTIQSQPGSYHFDFSTLTENDFAKIDIPFSLTYCKSGLTHGFAFWFDIGFFGSDEHIWLSTSPAQPVTHWYQVKCLFQKPIYIAKGQVLAGSIVMSSNKRLSYFVNIDASVESNQNLVSSAFIDLKNPILLAGTIIPKPSVLRCPSTAN